MTVGLGASARPLRVLHVVSSLAPRFGGTSKVVVEMCRALAHQGMSVTLFTTDRDERSPWWRLTKPRTLAVVTDRAYCENGVEIRYFSTEWPWHLVFSRQMVRELRRRMAEFDVVHIHSLYQFPGLAAGHYARVYRTPYLIMPHGALDPYLRRRHRYRKTMYHWLAKRRDWNLASAIHYTAQDELELVKPVGIKAPGVVVPLGINRQEFRRLPPPGAFRRLHPELHDGRLVVFLGRVTPKKGLDLLIRAFALVGKVFDDARLVIAGPDDEGHGAQVIDWLKAAQVYERTLVMGMVTGERKLELLADANVWVLPSYTENFGVAVLEAMACGLPVVISDRVNIHREVSRANAGLVVPCRAEDVASAIGNILKNSSLREQLSAAGKQLVDVDFTWNAVARRLAELYVELLSHPVHWRTDGMSGDRRVN